MHFRGIVLLGGLLVAVTMSRPLGAQRPVVVDVGLTGAQFPEDDSFLLGPSVRLSVSGTRGRLFGSATGGTIATVGGASGFASLAGAARSATRRGWSTELASELSSVVGSSKSGGAHTALLGGRVLWANSAAGSWLRTSGHVAARGFGTLTGSGVDAGAWWSGPRSQFVASLAHEWTRAGLFTGRFHTGFAGTAPVRYTDAAVALHLESDRASVDISAIARRDPDAARLVEGGLSVSTALWSSDTRAFVFTVAHQLPDWIRGADATDVVSVGMRFMQDTPAAARASRLIPVVQVADEPGGNSRVLRVRASGARQVEVMGDFTGWEAMPMTRNGAVFERSVTLGSGTHRLLLRIDGGAWRPAANTPAVDDDFGGRAGLLVVP